MKGGKAGRPRRAASSGPAKAKTGGKSKKTPRAGTVAPKKGSPKRPQYGGRSSTGEE